MPCIYTGEEEHRPMYIPLRHSDIFPYIIAGDIAQTTIKPLLNDKSQKSHGGSECLLLRSGNTIETCFGSAVITSIILYRGNCTLSNLQDTTREKWARNEGFSCYKDADSYFSKKCGDGWDTRDMMTIKFKGAWVQDE